MAFADLTPELLLDFNNDVEVKHAAPTQCFDVAMVDNDFAVVDCQLVSTKDGVTDIHYIVNARTKSYTAISMNGIVKTTGTQPNIFSPQDDRLYPRERRIPVVGSPVRRCRPLLQPVYIHLGLSR